jgi:hypothetical protein
MKTLCRDPACGLDWGGGFRFNGWQRWRKKQGRAGQCKVAELGFGVVGGG